MKLKYVYKELYLTSVEILLEEKLANTLLLPQLLYPLWEDKLLLTEWDFFGHICITGRESFL